MGVPQKVVSPSDSTASYKPDEGETVRNEEKRKIKSSVDETFFPLRSTDGICLRVRVCIKRFSIVSELNSTTHAFAFLMKSITLVAMKTIVVAAKRYIRYL